MYIYSYNNLINDDFIDELKREIQILNSLLKQENEEEQGLPKSELEVANPTIRNNKY